MSRSVRLILLCVGVGMLGLAIGLGPSLLRSRTPSETNSPSNSSSRDSVPAAGGTADWDPQLGSLPRFVDVTEQSGVEFVHTNGMTAGGYEYLEVMGGGVAAFDYDNDGDLDLYFSNGNNSRGALDPTITNRLFRNEGGMKFQDVTKEAGVGDPSYGQGCAAGDYDNDGDLDLYVTNYGPNVLYRNEGNGTFTDVTESAGVGDREWGQSVCFCDFDRDGWLDLFAQNYLKHGSTEGARAYIYIGQQKVADYPSPIAFPGAPDRLYRNLGDGTFRDVGPEVGISRTDGKGMGIACVDLDGDRWPDIFVANDTMENFFYRSLGQGRFTEEGQLFGLAYNESGVPEASMGVDAADYDQDGDVDLVVPCYSRQFFTLYRNQGKQCSDVSNLTGLAKATASATGFDGHFFDYDNDADLDFYFTCGAVRTLELAPADGTYNDRYGIGDLLVANDGQGRFTNVSQHAGPHFQRPLVGRGSVIADLDNDGDLDVVVSNLADRAVILRNDTQGGHWLTIELIDARTTESGWRRTLGYGRKATASRGRASRYDLLIAERSPTAFRLGKRDED